MKTKRGERHKKEDTELETELKRFCAQIKFVLESLPERERLVAEHIWHQTPDAEDDSRYIRMRQLIELQPHERSKLIESWEKELRLFGSH